jgi:hypothetical protein
MNIRNYIGIGLTSLALSSAGCKDQNVLEKCSDQAPSRDEITKLTGSLKSCDDLKDSKTISHCNKLSTNIREQVVATCLTSETGMKYKCDEYNEGVFHCNWKN